LNWWSWFLFRGIKKTFDKAKLSPFYWKDMQGTVKLYVNQCEICEERKNPTIKKRHLLKSYVVGAPFERMATDIAGPFPLLASWSHGSTTVVFNFFSVGPHGSTNCLSTYSKFTLCDKSLASSRGSLYVKHDDESG
jgi:hypothetical protein